MGLNRRQFVKASLAGAASLGVWGNHSLAYAENWYDTSDSRSTRGYDYGYRDREFLADGRKGYALCLAADRTAYGAPPLRSAEKDAHDMADILHRAGFQVRLWTGRNATTGRINDDLKRASEELRPGDVLYYTWAGHGTHQRDPQGDETDGQDEMWCTYNRPLLDDEQLAAFSRFQPGVRIRMISDCCHSGSAARMFEMVRAMEETRTRSLERGVGPRSLPVLSRDIRDAADYAQQVEDEVPTSVAMFRGIPDWQREEWENDAHKQRVMEDVKDRSTAGRDTSRVEASVLSLGACEDRQVSLDGANNGLFTETLKRVYNGGFRGSLRELGSQIGQYTTSQGQRPTLDGYGGRDGENEGIFTI